MRANARSLVTMCALAAGLCACSEGVPADESESLASVDPLLTRALHDPLMVDPDLAYRNEANAALTIRYDHPLPPFEAIDELADRAREEARLELLSDGPISDLPTATTGASGSSLAAVTQAGEMVKAAGGPVECTEQLREGLIWASRMPPTAAIMPHGMVQQAAGTETSDCNVRVVRYLTPVSIEDALQYHYTRADRARLRPSLFQDPEMIMRGNGRDEQIVVHARSGPGGTSAIDIIHWTR